MKAEVYFEDDPDFRFTLLDGLTIGREADVSVGDLPDNKFVSRVHATFIKDGDDWLIRDEHSTNHTYVNSVVLKPGGIRRLKDNDLVSLGYMSFVFTRKDG